MSPFASVALFTRSGQSTFRPPRKEASSEKTQARKSAARFWKGLIIAPDRLSKVYLVSVAGTVAHISECNIVNGLANRWVEYTLPLITANEQVHIRACLKELGVDPFTAPPPMPETLEINGVMYRRDI